MFDDDETVLLTIQADFVVKHPFQLPAPEPPPAPAFCQDAIEALFSGRTILTATDWAKSSNSKSFRPPNAQDREALLRAAAAARAHFHTVALPALIPEGAPYQIVSEVLDNIRFGCVSGRIEAIVLVGGFVATAITAAAAADDSWRDDWFGRPNVSVSCSAKVTGDEEVAHHMRTQLRYENSDLLDSENTACVVLRQRLLKNAGLYDGKVDGVYGTKTASAEIKMAARYGLDSDDLLTGYERLSAPPDTGSYNKKSARRR